MKYKIKSKNLIVEIPLKQKKFNPYMEDEDLSEIDNLIGIIANNEYTISRRIDMSYKGKIDQEGMPILHFNTEEELLEVCKAAKIRIRKYSACVKCGKVLRGTHTINDKGLICFDCDEE